MYSDGSGQGSGFTHCPNPQCDGWVWNSRKSVTHCRKCATPMQMPRTPKPLKGFGKGKYKGDGGKAVGPDLLSAISQPFPGAPWNWPYLPGLLSHKGGARMPDGSFGKGKGKDTAKNGKGPKGGRTQRDTPAGGDVAAAHIGEGLNKQMEAELAVAKQEVQFYRNLETKGLLAPGNRQMQQAQERLRKAKEKELGSRSLPQQARSLQDRRRNIEQKLTQQRSEAERISTQLCELCDQYEALADQHADLKSERDQTAVQLSVVQKAAAGASPGLWKPVGKPGTLDRIFLQFQEQRRELYPSLEQAQMEKLGESVTELYQTASNHTPDDSMVDLEQLHGPAKKARQALPGQLVGKHLLGAGALSGPQHFRLSDDNPEDGSAADDDMQGEGEEVPFIEGDPAGQKAAWEAQANHDLADDDDAYSIRSGKSGRSGKSASSRHSDILPGSKARGKVAAIAQRWAEFQSTSVRQTNLKKSGKGPSASASQGLAIHRESAQEDESDL